MDVHNPCPVIFQWSLRDYTNGVKNQSQTRAKTWSLHFRLWQWAKINWTKKHNRLSQPLFLSQIQMNKKVSAQWLFLEDVYHIITKKIKNNNSHLVKLGDSYKDKIYCLKENKLLHSNLITWSACNNHHVTLRWKIADVFVFSGGHIGFSRRLPLHYHFKIFHDIPHIQKHKFRH